MQRKSEREERHIKGTRCQNKWLYHNHIHVQHYMQMRNENNIQMIILDWSDSRNKKRLAHTSFSINHITNIIYDAVEIIVRYSWLSRAHTISHNRLLPLCSHHINILMTNSISSCVLCVHFNTDARDKQKKWAYAIVNFQFEHWCSCEIPTWMQFKRKLTTSNLPSCGLHSVANLKL